MCGECVCVCVCVLQPGRFRSAMMGRKITVLKDKEGKDGSVTIFGSFQALEPN